MSKLYFQKILEDITFENLPVKWQSFDLTTFSEKKKLFDFQTQAIKNAIKGLWFYFEEKKANKEAVFNHYRLNGLEEDLDYDLRKRETKKIAKYLLEYEKDYPVTGSKISFSNFINRMSFWMATGSGKTLIIVKLIGIVGKLIKDREIPEGDILFLAHRDDLIEQFKEHVEEYNRLNLDAKINLKSLKEYESVKHQSTLFFSNNEITIFYYRSDLISDESKEKIVNFRNYDGGGKWYIFLDEAHKGDREESKRQIFYSLLSRNGFLFNFSATFTDFRDFVTCAYNFNLSKFVEEGYAKHIYIAASDIKAFRDNEDFSSIQKQKIVLKTLLLYTYINKFFENIRRHDDSMYHRPLFLTLVNSVDVEDSDLELFFREIEKVARDDFRKDLLEEAKKELIQEFRAHSTFEFEADSLELNNELILELEYKDILKYVFNAKNPGNIEVLKIPENRNELIFRLMTSEKPFALIKIGDISGWLKCKLEGYEINESFENESYFRRLNQDDSDINILMGSRSFYEGWDSNRPNIILFINIGIGSDAKKFVLQSIGRGIRIEPQKNKRKRLQKLLNAKEVAGELFQEVKNLILPLETLFIFGTNAENLKEIIKTLQEEKHDRNLGEEFILNPAAQKQHLLIPVYKNSEKLFVYEVNRQKFNISHEDFERAKQFYDLLSDKIILVKYNCAVEVLKKAKNIFEEKEQYFNFSEGRSIYDPELILARVLDFFQMKGEEFDKFKRLENEIVHFKRIRFINGEKYDEIKDKIEKIRKYPEIQKDLDNRYGKIPMKEFERQMALIREAGIFELKNQRIKIKYITNHYYLPVIVSESEKIDYITHIITVDSEVRFIEELEEYLIKPENVFSRFDWWMFSKIDESIDEVYIPYYDPRRNTIAKFKPDFIFWAQKGQHYLILFVDPKGTEHTDGYRKIDGFSRIFEEGEQKESRSFSHNSLTIRVKLLLKARGGIESVLDNYRKYWFDSFTDFAEKIKDIL